MDTLKDTIYYLIDKYPYKNELSNARLTKLVYLSDWHQAINRQKQITSIDWYFDNYGPFVWDVENTVKENNDLMVYEEHKTIFGSPKKLFKIIDKSYKPELSEEQKNSLDHVIEKTKSLNFNDFIKLVYSTYPIMTSERYSKLNLVEKAKDYATFKEENDTEK
ncbi:MAG: SocA family protein [Vampirovibrionales bacterium]|jgi:hypothetical protein|nr:SocA family protein [Vampirovibrionales bacterium]